MKKSTSDVVHWTRVEAWAGVGIPDVNGAASFGEFWIENKVESRKTMQPLSLWRSSQISWQFARAQKINNVFNLVSRPRADTVEIYSCAQILNLVENQQLTDSGIIIPPDLVLTKPVKWQLLIDHIRDHLCKIANEPVK